MAHYTLIARMNTGDGRFPFVNVQFSKNHRPTAIEGATYDSSLIRGCSLLLRRRPKKPPTLSRANLRVWNANGNPWA